MKILGLIGGTSWLSTVDYYRYINEGINAQLGGIEFSHCILHSLNFGEIKRLADAGKFDQVGGILLKAAQHLKDGGAEGIVLCANTLHMFANDVENATGLPVIHIAAATARAINEQRLETVALLGTKPTMEQEFYKNILTQHGIVTMIPGDDDRDFIHESIFGELGKGIFTGATKSHYISIIESMAAAGAQGIILGCTEIPLIISQNDVSVPVFDTAKIHSAAAVAFSLGL